MTFEGVGKKEWSVKGQGQWDFVDATVLGTCLGKERREDEWVCIFICSPVSTLYVSQ